MYPLCVCRIIDVLIAVRLFEYPESFHVSFSLGGKKWKYQYYVNNCFYIQAIIRLVLFNFQCRWYLIIIPDFTFTLTDPLGIMLYRSFGSNLHVTQDAWIIPGWNNTEQRRVIRVSKNSRGDRFIYRTGWLHSWCSVNCIAEETVPWDFDSNYTGNSRPRMYT